MKTRRISSSDRRRSGAHDLQFAALPVGRCQSIRLERLVLTAKKGPQPGVAASANGESVAPAPAIDIEAKVIANELGSLQTVELSNVDGQLRR